MQITQTPAVVVVIAVDTRRLPRSDFPAIGCAKIVTVTGVSGGVDERYVRLHVKQPTVDACQGLVVGQPNDLVEFGIEEDDAVDLKRGPCGVPAAFRSALACCSRERCFADGVESGLGVAIIVQRGHRELGDTHKPSFTCRVTRFKLLLAEAAQRGRVAEVNRSGRARRGIRCGSLKDFDDDTNVSGLQRSLPRKVL
jgi:hypothetical protein